MKKEIYSHVIASKAKQSSLLFIKYAYLIFSISIFSFIISGCNSPQTNSEKQSRLIAVENIELKKQIEELNLQIETIQKQHKKEIKARDESLENAQKEIETLKEQSKKQIQEQVEQVLDAVIQQNTELRKEIDSLKEQLQSQ